MCFRPDASWRNLERSPCPSEWIWEASSWQEGARKEDWNEQREEGKTQDGTFTLRKKKKSALLRSTLWNVVVFGPNNERAKSTAQQPWQTAACRWNRKQIYSGDYEHDFGAMIKVSRLTYLLLVFFFGLAHGELLYFARYKCAVYYYYLILARNNPEGV